MKRYQAAINYEYQQAKGIFMTPINSFEDLNCWKACREVVQHITMITRRYPSHEKYELTNNMRRAARSSSRNIAEGFGRHHHQENLQFCRISRGSLFELIDDLITSLEENYISENDYAKCRASIIKAIRIINGYIRYLEKAKNK